MGREEFINSMMPFALDLSKRIGIDPRLIVAQSALETGWGKSAPGNNYFGIKGPGQVQSTTEYGAGGPYRTNESFRDYPNMGASVMDYGNVLMHPRYDSVRNAQGFDAQLAALAKSPYATDPNYGSKVGSIARGITVPTGGQGAQPAAVPAAGNVAAAPSAGPRAISAKEMATQDKNSGFLSGQKGMDFAVNMGLGLLSQAQPQQQAAPPPLPMIQPQAYRPDPRQFMMGLLG